MYLASCWQQGMQGSKSPMPPLWEPLSGQSSWLQLRTNLELKAHSDVGVGVERGREGTRRFPGEGLYLAEDDRECTRRMRKDGDFWPEEKQEHGDAKAHWKMTRSWLRAEPRKYSIERHEKSPQGTLGSSVKTRSLTSLFTLFLAIPGIFNTCSERYA